MSGTKHIVMEKRDFIAKYLYDDTQVNHYCGKHHDILVNLNSKGTLTLANYCDAIFLNRDVVRVTGLGRNAVALRRNKRPDEFAALKEKTLSVMIEEFETLAHHDEKS